MSEAEVVMCVLSSFFVAPGDCVQNCGFWPKIRQILKRVINWHTSVLDFV